MSWRRGEASEAELERTTFELYLPSALPGLIEGIWEQRMGPCRDWTILPSGSVELIFRLGPSFSLRSAKRLAPDARPTRPFCFLSGLHTGPLGIGFDGFHVFGIRMHAVAIRALFGIPTSELRDGALEGEHVLRDLAWIEDHLRSAPDFAARARWVEATLIPRILRSRDLDAAEQMRKMAAFVLDAEPAPGRSVVDRLGYSRSHTHRLFSEWLGHSLTAHVRLTRFVRAVHALHEPRTSLSEVACRLGYFDHAHLTRSFRELSGMTPTEYRARRPPAPGYVRG